MTAANMVDLNTLPRTPPPPSAGVAAAGGGEERFKIRGFMGRAPSIGVLKTKFLTVLGNSNELLTGISNKFALNISSSDSDCCDDEEEQVLKFDETIDYTSIDFESRRIKARRAHEEIISGRFRYPHLLNKNGSEVKNRSVNLIGRNKPRTCSSSSSTSSSSSSTTSSSRSIPVHFIDRSQKSSTTCSISIESSRHSGGYGRPGRVIAGARRSDMDIQRDLLRIKDLLNPSLKTVASGSSAAKVTEELDLTTETIAEPAMVTDIPVCIPIGRGRTSNSSTLTSLHDEIVSQASPSSESITDWRNFKRSESQNSVPSWASSISLDCRAGEESIKDFMQRFTDVLFADVATVTLEMKAEFGELVHLDAGRQWFARFLLKQKVRSKRVDDLTFHSLLQYLAIVLFECNESEDYQPATVIMNLCFSFYQEIEVPGCDPYREYLYMFMRQQPIWHTLRFWNAAFAEIVHTEYERRLAINRKRLESKNQEQLALPKPTEENQRSVDSSQKKPIQSRSVESNKDDAAASLANANSNANAIVTTTVAHHKSSRRKNMLAGSSDKDNTSIKKSGLNETQLKEAITLHQLGTFTCNMHALGIPQLLCKEFFQKQSVSLNMNNDKMHSIQENIARMYRETDQWGAKDC